MGKIFTNMTAITDIQEANNLLERFEGAAVQVWMFHITHRRLAIKLSRKGNYEDIIYLAAVQCSHISGPFSWEMSDLKIHSIKDKETAVITTTIADRNSSFELICLGGFSLIQGSEEELGKIIQDFYWE